MITFKKSDLFEAWFAALKDTRAKARILARVLSAEKGNFGDCQPVGSGVSEMRIHYGPGYRLYYTRRGEVVYLLLLGGDKSTQKRDIARALEMAARLEKDQP
ncbi:putative addiction module killer protein [Ensifer adhaerens]|nr:putative addiction module killer protein [Ensifer adhaerens]